MKDIIFKRPGSPCFYITGLRKSTGTSNKKLAMEIAFAELEKDLKGRKLGINAIREWDDLVDLWTREKSDKASFGLDTYIIAHVTKLIIKRRLKLLSSVIDSDVIETYLLSVKQANSASTANRHLNTLKAMFKMALERRWIVYLPNFPKFKDSRRLVVDLTVDQVEAIIEYIVPKYIPIVRIALLTGMRRANVVGLRWEWINRDMTVITVPAQFTKADRTYTAVLNDQAREVLGEHKGKGLCFDIGDVMPEAVSTAFVKAARRAGYKAHFHQLRHTWASNHVQNNTPDRVLMAIGGWQSPAMLSRYAHLRTDHLTQFAENSSKAMSIADKITK